MRGCAPFNGSARPRCARPAVLPQLSSPKGALHNENDLVLRPDHRLFVYQRKDHMGAGRAEVLIKARHLVDDESVTRRRGGFIDYFQAGF